MGAEKLVGGDTTSDNNRFCIRVKFEGGGGFFEQNINSSLFKRSRKIGDLGGGEMVFKIGTGI